MLPMTGRAGGAQKSGRSGLRNPTQKRAETARKPHFGSGSDGCDDTKTRFDGLVRVVIRRVRAPTLTKKSRTEKIGPSMPPHSRSKKSAAALRLGSPLRNVSGSWIGCSTDNPAVAEFVFGSNKPIVLTLNFLNRRNCSEERRFWTRKRPKTGLFARILTRFGLFGPVHKNFQGQPDYSGPILCTNAKNNFFCKVFRDKF